MFRIENCFDSHVHWKETGEKDRRLSLGTLTRSEDVAYLKPESHHFRGDWLLGFGWDQSKWQSETGLPHRRTLDRTFGPERAICFYRADGHAIWTSSEGLRRVGLLDHQGQPTELAKADPAGGWIVRDRNGIPTGVLVDLAAEPMSRMLPPLSHTEIRACLWEGMRLFNRAGFTHIRDLSCDAAQWDAAVDLHASGYFTLAVEQFFNANQPADFERTLTLALRAKKANLKQIRAKGIKIYFDGALGSDGALLSQPYPGCESHGLSFMEPKHLAEMMRRTWEAGLEMAVHVIGDAASDQVIKSAVALWDTGVVGRLHLEHVELARPESLELLVGRDVVCHMQPCHWLTDRAWAKSKLGSLFEYLFPWGKIEALGLPMDFGSDSPIEVPSLFDTEEGLVDAMKHGVPGLTRDWKSYCGHTDELWIPDTYSQFFPGGVAGTQVTFSGKQVEL